MPQRPSGLSKVARTRKPAIVAAEARAGGNGDSPTVIRALYVETLARAEYEQDRELNVLMGDAPPWSDADENQRQYYRDTAVVHLVDALAAAGLLPTVVLSRVHPCDCQPCPDCETAALAEGSVRQQRYATEWLDLPASTFEGSPE